MHRSDPFGPSPLRFPRRGRRVLSAAFASLAAAAIVAGLTVVPGAAAAGGSTTPAGGAPERAPWNVVLLTVDNLRPDRMSVYGHDRPTTPNLEALAAEGARFDQAFATSAWTSPGVVSIWTGYHPPVHAQSGRYSWYDRTMPSALRVLDGAGYEILGEAISGPSHEDFGFESRPGHPPDRLMSFLEQRKPDAGPFFVWSHLRHVHLPYDPEPDVADRFGVPDRDSAAIRAVKEHKLIFRDPVAADVPYRHAGAVTFAAADEAAVRALYDAEVAEVDAYLGKIFDRLKASGLWDSTVVVITADHGEELFDHGWVGHASTSYDPKLYDELIHIPLIVRTPGGGFRGSSDALVQQTDIMPTVLDLLGVEATGVVPPWQGGSAAPLIRGEVEAIRDHVFAHTTARGWTTPKEDLGRQLVAVRSRDRKLIRIPTAGGVRMEGYDLAADPGETTNLYPADPTAFVGLEQALADHDAANAEAAATLVLTAAGTRLAAMVEALGGEGGLPAAVPEWKAIAAMAETWALTPDPFFAHEPYGGQWRALQRRAAQRMAAAFACRATRTTAGTAGGCP